MGERVGVCWKDVAGGCDGVFFFSCPSLAASFVGWRYGRLGVDLIPFFYVVFFSVDVVLLSLLLNSLDAELLDCGFF